MKNAALVVCLLMAFGAGLFFYGTFPRDNSISYEVMMPTELYKVTCISDDDKRDSYHMTMPSFEGFSEEEEFDLIEVYKQGFCDSL